MCVVFVTNSAFLYFSFFALEIKVDYLTKRQRLENRQLLETHTVKLLHLTYTICL